MRLFGLIGYPLGHSFSKTYFTEKFIREGITGCAYELFPIKNISELPGLIRANSNLEGLNITIPYKKDVMPLLKDSYIPEGLEACNCIAINKGNLTGYNTDIVGFEKSFLDHWKPSQKKALILGAGGAAEAVKFVFQKLGISYRVAGRTLKKGIDILFSEISPSIILENTVIVNCTPLGTYPKIEEFPPIPYEAITPGHFLFDLVYNPPKTLFLIRGEQQGALTENGYKMLVYQAEEAWRIWNTNK
jgi:shikimate dehydrogenase